VIQFTVRLGIFALNISCRQSPETLHTIKLCTSHQYHWAKFSQRPRTFQSPDALVKQLYSA